MPCFFSLKSCSSCTLSAIALSKVSLEAHRTNFEEEVLRTEYSGFMAQQVQQIFPEAVGTDDDGYLNFNIHPILVASVNAFKELNAKNRLLEEEVSTLKQELQAQNNLLQQVLQRLQTLENN